MALCLLPLSACDSGALWLQTASDALTARRGEVPERLAGQANRSLTPEAFDPDPARVEAQRVAALEWYRGMLRGSYERVGSRDPRWDTTVLQSLDVLATRNALVPDRPADSWDRARLLLRRALSDGADDPLIALLAAELLRHDYDRRAAARLIRNAAVALEQSAYPAYWRGYGLISAAAALLEAGRGTNQEEWTVLWREIRSLLDRALALYPAVLEDEEIPDHTALSYINWLASTFVRTTGHDRSIVEGPAAAAVATAREAGDPLGHLLRGWFAAHAAWDARGTDFAGQVADDAWPVFYTRLAEAEAHAAKAVQAGSINPAVPAIMLRVGVGLHGDPEELDAWFTHGVTVEPGDRSWYEAKLDWLLPKWFGSPTDALDFAREAARSGNWALRLPFLVEDAWRGLSGGELPLEACAEVMAIHAAFVALHPDSPTAHAQQQTLAAHCSVKVR